MLIYRKPSVEDLILYFNWTNDTEVRSQSFSSANIDLLDHNQWFTSKLTDKSCFMLIFQDDNNSAVGQVRIEKQDENQALIGISIASESRGMGYAKEMLKIASDLFLKENVGVVINAYIKESNLNSKYAFEKAGFIFKGLIDYKNFKSLHYIK